MPERVAASAVRSYRTLSPWPRRPKPRGAVSSLWHCPWAWWGPAGGYPAPRLHGARTFLPGRKRPERPPGRLTFPMWAGSTGPSSARLPARNPSGACGVCVPPWPS